ncbi:hypothetical protein MKW98_005450 [Papaver atlanticum]|uniref:Uncharacterized protein n=1 Tax=Papaver atlanticum TaxID=357466 RepID=A0AAD4T9W1_9MAGN|nr:hypothetical protein MKW98_005450 [Papaver atlanticum]
MGFRQILYILLSLLVLQKNFISESGIDGAEVGDMRKSFTSFRKVGDVKDASDLVSKEREESKHSQLGTPGSKTMKKDVPSLPSSCSKKKKQYSNARECPNLNLKRSRSGNSAILFFN